LNLISTYSIYVTFSFLTLYNRPDVDLFGLDDAAAKLGEFYLSCLPINFVFDWVLDKLYYALSNWF